MKLILIAISLFSIPILANYNADRISNAKELGLVCQTPNFDSFTNGVAVRVEFQVLETGINTLKFDESLGDTVLFTFQNRENFSNHTYTESYNSALFSPSVFNYSLSGFHTFDAYGKYDKLFELFNGLDIEGSTNAFGSGFDFLISESNQEGSFELMLSGDNYNQYQGFYNVNCYVATLN